jgi:hypothetical protein
LLFRLSRGLLTVDLVEPGLGEVGVDGGGVEALVAEERLDDAQVGAALDEVGGERVAQRAGGHRLCDAGLAACGAEGALDAGGGDRLAGVLSLQQILHRPVALPALAQLTEQRLAEHHLPVFPALAALHPDDHALGVDVAWLEVDDLVGAQARAVAQHERGPVLRAGRCVENGLDLLRAQHLGQALGPARTRQLRPVPVGPLQHLPEEAAQRVGRHPHARVAQAPRGHVYLVGHDVVGARARERTLAEEAREALQGVKVVVDRALGTAIGAQEVGVLARQDRGVGCHACLQGRLKILRDRSKLVPRRALRYASAA